MLECYVVVAWTNCQKLRRLAAEAKPLSLRQHRICQGEIGRLQAFAGMPDLADPARFTIAYQMNGEAGSIVGRRTENDTIDLDFPYGQIGPRVGSDTP